MPKELSELPISDSLWWVVPERLAGVRKPTTSELATLCDQGIKAIVSVLDDSSTLDLYKQQKIPHLWLPIKGGTAPSIEQVKKLTTFVELQNTLGHGVAVHCSNGRRRTATLLAAYLIQQGYDYKKAMDFIQTANPTVELRLNQIIFLKELSAQRI